MDRKLTREIGLVSDIGDMKMKINWIRAFMLIALFLTASTAVQAQSIEVNAESGNKVPIEGTWVFPNCGPDEEYGEYNIQEFLIFTGNQVEGRVVGYAPGDLNCAGEGANLESETGTVIPGGTVGDAEGEVTCWDGDAPPQQQPPDRLAEHPVVTRLIYLLDENGDDGDDNTETGLFYIDDTAETWYLWRNVGGGDDEDEEDLSPGPECQFLMSSEEPLRKLSPATVSVMIDIKPGSGTNPVNPRSKGVIPVAVLGSIDFDATQIDYSTTAFGPAEASSAHDGHVKDVNADGFMDMVFHFKTRETGIVCGDTETTLSGETFDGTPFSGTDTLNTVGCK